MVYVFEQARDGICCRADRVWHIPEDVRGRKAVPLDCQSKAHIGRVLSRVVALAVASTRFVNFWRAQSIGQ
jgi:hypothetical protein